MKSKNLNNSGYQKHEIMLNLACGNRIHPDWHNLDFSPSGKLVKKANLLGQLPYNNGTVSYVYSSHFLEHIPIRKAFHFLSECARREF